jgi:hypothetical protein
VNAQHRCCLLLLAWIAGSFAQPGAGQAVGSAVEVAPLLSDLGSALDPRPTDVPTLLWEMARDAEAADAVLDRANATHRALVDTLLCFVSLEEPAARAQLPALFRIDDRVITREGRPPAWADVRWQGVRLLRILAPDPGVGRDVRLARELDAAMARVSIPQPAAVAGAVIVLRDWWAERGEDPQLTHDQSRVLDLDPWLKRLDLLPEDPDAWMAPQLLADLDRDMVLRERLLERLSPQRHAHLAAELVSVLPMLPDSLETLGIERPGWDPQTHEVVGHAAIDLWNLAVRMLEIVTGEPVSGGDDRSRRLAALLWWDGHRHEARYWRDPRQAPDLGRFLRELDVPEEEGGPNAGAWARSLYLEPAVAELVLERLGPEHRGIVAELIALLPLNRDQAHAAGFVMAARRRSVIADPGSSSMVVGLVWAEARAFVRRLIAVLTGIEPPAGLDAASADAFWLQWWQENRDDPQWSRGTTASGRRGP